ncbi:hypothetical protein MRX96_008795 [Rhipicephalus microplus]
MSVHNLYGCPNGLYMRAPLGFGDYLAFQAPRLEAAIVRCSSSTECCQEFPAADRSGWNPTLQVPDSASVFDLKIPPPDLRPEIRPSRSSSEDIEALNPIVLDTTEPYQTTIMLSHADTRLPRNVSFEKAQIPSYAEATAIENLPRTSPPAVSSQHTMFAHDSSPEATGSTTSGSSAVASHHLAVSHHPCNQLLQNQGHTSLALSATRTSSFAAALRKLAKQAVDPVLEKDSGPVVSITGGNPRSLTPKRSSSYGLPSPMACGSPPVMSGAPSGLLMETRKALDLGSLSSQHGHRLDHTTKMDSSLSSLDYLSSKHLTGPPSGASGAGHKGAPGNGEECPRGFQPYRGSAEELRHPTLGTLHPMSPFDAGAYPYHPTPFLAPHLAHPGYRLEDPFKLLHNSPPAQQQQRQQLTPPSLPVGPPRTDEFKEEQSRLLLLSSAKRTSDSPSPSLSSSHSGGAREPLRSPPISDDSPESGHKPFRASSPNPKDYSSLSSLLRSISAIRLVQSPGGHWPAMCHLSTIYT